MNVLELCKYIELNEEVFSKISEFEADSTILKITSHFSTLISALTEAERAGKVNCELEEKLSSKEFSKINQKGLLTLYIHLKAACISFDKYFQKGINMEIYKDTMKCFSRFVNEHIQSYKQIGFDRAFWTYRQLSLQLFRIGELEYEIISPKESAIHIPSDADISISKCKNSYEKYCNFLKNTNAIKPLIFSLDSWLLSPALDNLLDSTSKILSFKKCFEITEWDKDSKEFMQWVFGSENIKVENLPEKTSLQRNIKSLLLKGGKIGSAKGYLKKF